MKYIFAYLALIVFVNLGFSYLPTIPTVLGNVPAMAFFVGGVFVLRDYAQRNAGHHVLWAMAVGCVIAYAFGDPHVVYASVAAFAISELADWLLFTITKKPFYKRVMISSIIAVPLDSIVFLWLIGVVNPAAMAAMTLSKLAASVILYLAYDYRRRQMLCVDEGCDHHGTEHVCVDRRGKPNGNSKGW